MEKDNSLINLEITNLSIPVAMEIIKMSQGCKGAKVSSISSGESVGEDGCISTLEVGRYYSLDGTVYKFDDFDAEADDFIFVDEAGAFLVTNVDLLSKFEEI